MKKMIAFFVSEIDEEFYYELTTTEAKYEKFKNACLAFAEENTYDQISLYDLISWYEETHKDEEFSCFCDCLASDAFNALQNAIESGKFGSPEEMIISHYEDFEEEFSEYYDDGEMVDSEGAVNEFLNMIENDFGTLLYLAVDSL